MNPKRENAGRISGEFGENLGRKQGESREKQGESWEKYRLETLKFPSSLGCASQVSIRFENHFKYVINIAENTSTGSIMIPPMLLQPFVENATWHGLMQKRAKGAITIDIRKEDEKFLHLAVFVW